MVVEIGIVFLYSIGIVSLIIILFVDLYVLLFGDVLLCMCKIIYCDCDCFYVLVEMCDDLLLCNWLFVVGGCFD